MRPSRASHARRAAAAAILAAALVAHAAAAQDLPTVGGSAEVASGVEGGGKGHAAGVRRARTSLRVGGEVSLAETPGPSLGAALLVEIEPRASVGADVRYVHLLDEHLAFHLGALGIVAPSTLFGASAGAEYRLPIHRHVALTFGPTFQAFFFGSDLPDGIIIWQGLFHVGIHVQLR